MIEKGSYVRPRVERYERKCFICRNDIEEPVLLYLDDFQNIKCLTFEPKMTLPVRKRWRKFNMSSR